MIIGAAGNNALTDQLIEQLSQLQVEILPRSLISRLGRRYARHFYRYAAKSSLEAVSWRERRGRVQGGCVLSLSPHTLNRRLAMRTPLIVWLVARAARLPWRVLLRAAVGVAPGTADELPEVILVFVAPGERSRGIGAELLADCERHLAGHGVRDYIVKTFDEEGHPALRFYLRQGFVEHGRVLVHGEPYRILRKRIVLH
jgi:GNAT superfamily N-acetyltransferase